MLCVIVTGTTKIKIIMKPKSWNLVFLRCQRMATTALCFCQSVNKPWPTCRLNGFLILRILACWLEPCWQSLRKVRYIDTDLNSPAPPHQRQTGRQMAVRAVRYCVSSYCSPVSRNHIAKYRSYYAARAAVALIVGNPSTASRQVLVTHEPSVATRTDSCLRC